MQKTSQLIQAWMDKKIQIEFSQRLKMDAKVGEFRWYYEGVNVGNEISKDGNFKRPCLILQNNMGNGLLLITPITTKFHNRMDRYSIDLKDYEKYGLKPSRVLLNQIKLIDPKRLEYLMSEERISVGFVNKVLYEYHTLVIQKNLASRAR